MTLKAFKLDKRAGRTCGVTVRRTPDGYLAKLCGKPAVADIAGCTYCAAHARKAAR